MWIFDWFIYILILIYSLHFITEKYSIKLFFFKFHHSKMGISADRSGTALSTALNLFSILSLPMSPEELDRDMAAINRHMHELLPKLFDKYDRTMPPYPRNGGPVEVISYMLVDHIEELNWLDERLSWEPEDYGHLDKLSFNGFDLTRFWWPGVTVKGITMPTRQLAMFHNTAYTLMYTGHIFAEMAISVKAACRLDLANYPNDNQTCFVMVFTPFYPSSRVTFTASSTVMSRHSLFTEQQMTIASGFQLDRLDSQRFFAYAKGFTLNQSEADLFSSLTNTVLRYQICLRRRDNGLYAATVSLPLFSIAVMAFSAIFVHSIRLSLLWLFSCIALLQIQNGRMAQFLPQDFDSEPLCIRFSRFLLYELLFLLAYRLWFAYQLARIQRGEDGGGLKITDQGILPQFISRASPESRNSLHRLHSRVKWVLMVELVFIFFWIFW